MPIRSVLVCSCSIELTSNAEAELHLGQNTEHEAVNYIRFFIEKEPKIDLMALLADYLDNPS